MPIQDCAVRKQKLLAFLWDNPGVVTEKKGNMCSLFSKKRKGKSCIEGNVYVDLFPKAILPVTLIMPWQAHQGWFLCKQQTSWLLFWTGRILGWNTFPFCDSKYGLLLTPMSADLKENNSICSMQMFHLQADPDQDDNEQREVLQSFFSPIKVLI